MTSRSSVGSVRVPDSLSATRPMDDGTARPYVPSDGVTGTSSSSDAYTADPLYSSVPRMRMQSHFPGSGIVGAAETDFPSVSTRFGMPAAEARSSMGEFADSDPNYSSSQREQRARLGMGEANRLRLEALRRELKQAVSDDEVILILREMRDLREPLPTKVLEAIREEPSGGTRSKRSRSKRSRSKRSRSKRSRSKRSRSKRSRSRRRR